VLVSLIEGVGSSTTEDGQTFYFWQDDDLRNMFLKHGLKIFDFNRNALKVNSRDKGGIRVLYRLKPGWTFEQGESRFY